MELPREEGVVRVIDWIVVIGCTAVVIAATAKGEYLVASLGCFLASNQFPRES